MSARKIKRRTLRNLSHSKKFREHEALGRVLRMLDECNETLSQTVWVER